MTILSELQAAGLPVISADENNISMGAMTDDQENLYADVLMKHFQPDKFAELSEERLDKSDLKAQVITAINRLTQIENAVNPTNAQLIAAVKDMATYEKKIIRILARMI